MFEAGAYYNKFAIRGIRLPIGIQTPASQSTITIDSTIMISTGANLVKISNGRVCLIIGIITPTQSDSITADSTAMVIARTDLGVCAC